MKPIETNMDVNIMISQRNYCLDVSLCLDFWEWFWLLVFIPNYQLLTLSSQAQDVRFWTFSFTFGANLSSTTVNTSEYINEKEKEVLFESQYYYYYFYGS